MKQDSNLLGENLVQRLEDESKGLIIMKGDKEIFSSTEPGIAGLLKATEKVEPTLLSDSIIVDKVVGKAAALIIVYFRAREVHAGIMSRAATSVLQEHSKAFSYLKLVDEIKGRNGLGTCRFEEMVSGIEDPEEALNSLKRAMA